MNVYIVTYDVSDNKRRAQLYHYLRGWGDHLQYSVFRCVLSRSDRVRLVAAVEEFVHHTEDQVLLFDLGPHEGRALGSVESIGSPYTHPERHAVIL